MWYVPYVSKAHGGSFVEGEQHGGLEETHLELALAFREARRYQTPEQTSSYHSTDGDE